MKKLDKLQINTEKVLKNEELLNLKGGDYSYLCRCGGGSYFFVSADDIWEAINIAYDYCDYGNTECTVA